MSELNPSRPKKKMTFTLQTHATKRMRMQAAPGAPLGPAQCWTHPPWGPRPCHRCCGPLWRLTLPAGCRLLYAARLAAWAAGQCWCVAGEPLPWLLTVPPCQPSSGGVSSRGRLAAAVGSARHGAQLPAVTAAAAPQQRVLQAAAAPPHSCWRCLLYCAVLLREVDQRMRPVPHPWCC
jgi:hypothetical protein